MRAPHPFRRFDERISKRFTKAYLVDLSRPDAPNWRGLISSTLFLTLVIAGIGFVMTSQRSVFASVVAIVAALLLWLAAVPIARYWWRSGRFRYPYPSVGKLRYFVTHNGSLHRRGTVETVDSQGRKHSKPCIDSCAKFLVREDDRQVIVRALKLADDYSLAVTQLDDGLSALFALPVESKSDQLDHCDYIFLKTPDTRITMETGGGAAPTFSLPRNEIPLSSGLVWKLDKQPHCICAGGTGSGKSTFINFLIREFFLRDAIIYVADPKSSDLASLGQILGDHVASEPNQIARVVRECRDLMESRYAAHLAPESFSYGSSWVEWGERPAVLFFDELGAFRAGTPKKVYDETFGYLSEIILKGRQSGVFVVLSAQQPRAETIPTDLRDQMSLRVGLGNISNECARMVFGSADVSGLRSVSAPGEGYILLDGLGWNAPKPFSAPFVDYSGMDFMQEVSALYAASSMAKEAEGQVE